MQTGNPGNWYKYIVTMIYKAKDFINAMKEGKKRVSCEKKQIKGVDENLNFLLKVQTLIISCSFHRIDPKHNNRRASDYIRESSGGNRGRHYWSQHRAGGSG